MPLRHVSQIFYSSGLPAIERYLNEKDPEKLQQLNKMSKSMLVLLVNPLM